MSRLWPEDLEHILLVKTRKIRDKKTLDAEETDQYELGKYYEMNKRWPVL